MDRESDEAGQKEEAQITQGLVGHGRVTLPTSQAEVIQVIEAEGDKTCLKFVARWACLWGKDWKVHGGEPRDR